MNTRQATNFIIDAIDEEMVPAKETLIELLGWLSEDEVDDFVKRSGYFDELLNY